MYDIRQSTVLDIMIFAHDSNGDAVLSKVTGDWTKRISKNGGAFAAMTVTITEAENGWYSLQLSTAHTDTLGVLSMTFTASGVKQINLQYRVHARINDDLAYPAVTGRSIQVETDGMVHGDVKEWLGSAPSALVSGRVDSSVGAMAANVVTAAAIANGAIDSATFAAGAIDAAAIATGAIDADAIAADALTELRGATVSGTSDSGTTTTMVDAARTESDSDYWVGSFILFTSGAISGQCRLITAFNPTTDTITFAPATTQAVSTQNYEILPNGRVDIHFVLGAVINALISGRVDASVGAVAAGAITAAAIATGAIDADALAADAVTEIRDSILSDATPFQGARIDATISSRATPAQVNTEVLDVLTVDTFAEVSGVPAATSTIKDKLNWLFALGRNRITQTATQQALRNDADSSSIATATVSDDGTTFVRSEFS